MTSRRAFLGALTAVTFLGRVARADDAGTRVVLTRPRDFTMGDLRTFLAMNGGIQRYWVCDSCKATPADAKGEFGCTLTFSVDTERLHRDMAAWARMGRPDHQQDTTRVLRDIQAGIDKLTTAIRNAHSD